MGKTDTLDPAIKDKVVALLSAAKEATGVEWTVTCGRRTMAEQAAIYAQGRTAPGQIVSNAKPGSSAHNYGLAADLAPLHKDGIWWNAPEALWRKMGECAEKLGLTWGGHFSTIKGGDKPHVELAVWRERRVLWQQGKLKLL